MGNLWRFFGEFPKNNLATLDSQLVSKLFSSCFPMLTVVRVCLYAVILLHSRKLFDLVLLPLSRLHDLDAVGLGGALLGKDEVLGAADPRHVTEQGEKE
jgi:hypothetical protein